MKKILIHTQVAVNQLLSQNISNKPKIYYQNSFTFFNLNAHNIQNIKTYKILSILIIKHLFINKTNFFHYVKKKYFVIILNRL